MRKEQYKKYIYAGTTAFLVIILSILFFFCMFRLSDIRNYVRVISNILMPIIYGLVIAYLLTPVYNFLIGACRKVLSPHIKNMKNVKKLSSAISIGISLFLFIFIVFGLLYLVVPQVIASAIGIAESFPKNVTGFSIWLKDMFKNNPEIEGIVLTYYGQAVAFVENYMSIELVPNLEKIITGLSSGLIGFVVVVKNILIGLIVAVYVLSSKAQFLAQSKKLIYSVFKSEAANSIIDEFRFAHKVFGGFIRGKLLDSLIIGILCFLGMRIMNMPYVMLISVIIGVTNIIPFFGPFIGAVPAALIILLVDPVKCLYFIIFIIVLQQFDGNILGPKILGDSTGLSSFWVLFSILLFGGMWGFVGMVTGVPVFAVIYHMISTFINKSLEKKNLTTDTMFYLYVKRIKPAEEEEEEELPD